MAKSFSVKKQMISTLSLVGVIGFSGCTSVGNLIEPSRIDYKSASKATTTSLEVPPDLTQIRRDNRFAIPDANQGSATASTFNLQKGSNATAANSGLIAPIQVQDMRIERDGSQRWLTVKQTPEALWPQLKDFWQELGFLVNVENQEAGYMETDWAENRAKIPQDILRNTLGKVIDSLYSTGERDKFRTRIERSGNGTVEIYISHRGAEEVLVGTQRDSGTTWTSRPSDSGLEAEFLTRLMVRLGSDGQNAKVAMDKVTLAPLVSRSKLLADNGINYLETDEGFDRSWRRVGLALDRIGFTVEDRDRSKGVYFVRYIDQDIEAKTKGASDGFFSKLFSFGSNEVTKSNQKYRIFVKESGAVSHVTVHNSDGKVDTSPVAEKILKLLNEQLK